MEQSWKLIDVGRDKVNREIKVKHPRQILKEVKKHLASKCIDIYFSEDGRSGEIIVGGFRAVGKIELIK